MNGRTDRRTDKRMKERMDKRTNELETELEVWHFSPTCRNIVARSQPPIDASQDITNAMATHENGITTVTFTRPLISDDPDDLSLIDCQFFFYGWGGSADTTSRMIRMHESTPIISNDRVCLPSPTECESIVCGLRLEEQSYLINILWAKIPCLPFPCLQTVYWEWDCAFSWIHILLMGMNIPSHHQWCSSALSPTLPFPTHTHTHTHTGGGGTLHVISSFTLLLTCIFTILTLA